MHERQQIARGVVFEDRGATGVRQPGDPGVPGVLVSNGRDITKTDRDGRYHLTVESGSAIFVIKPKGWSTPLDPLTKLPRFYHIHQPEGSPAPLGLAWSGVEPTGPMPDSLDFPLRRAPEPASFEVLMFADPQPADAAELDYLLEGFVSPLAATNAAFGVTLGDVMSDNLGLYDKYNLMMAQIGVPWWNAPGNHDLNYESNDQRFARETWKRVFGPPWYAFAFGDAMFIMLDNVRWERTCTGAAGYQGGIGDEQLAFVRNLLANTPTETLIVLCMHIPLVCSEKDSPSCNTGDRGQLLQLLGSRPAVSFSGHMHASEHHYLGAEDGCRAPAPHHHQVLAAVSGSWWSGPFDSDGQPLAQCCDGSPNGYYVLAINGARFSTRFVSRENPKMRIMLDCDRSRADGAPPSKRATALATHEASHAKVLVNVFDGGPLTEVTLSTGNGEPLPMQRVARVDPFTQYLFAMNPISAKPWVQATQSTHLWSASLPKDLAKGFHRAIINVRDEYGRRYSQSLVFEIDAG